MQQRVDAVATVPISASRPRLPKDIGGYPILGFLGNGAMGLVYEAQQLNPIRRVAIKVMKPGQPFNKDAVRMFKQEPNALARMQHPNIATIHTSGRTEEGQEFFVMEFVQGETLKDWLDKRPKTPSSPELKLRLKLFRTLCDAVNYAHLQGIIHLDLKPANIMIQEEGGSKRGVSTGIPTIKVLDFGLAQIVEPDPGAANQMAIGGTPQYMSPEQTRGDIEAIDVRTDVYSLGIILYELVLNRRPYDLSKAAIEDFSRIIREQPPQQWDKSWDNALRPNTDLWAIIEKALKKQPNERYNSAAHLGDDIARYLSYQPIDAKPPSLRHSTWLFWRRHPVGVSVAVSMFLFVAGVAIDKTFQAKRLARQVEITSSVASFLESMFEIWDPKNAKGKTFTAKEVLDEAAKKLDSRMVEDPEIQARLMTTLGILYTNLGETASAQTLFEKSLNLHLRVLGPNHTITLGSMNNLANVLFEQGRYPEAEKLHMGILQIRQRVLGPNHPSTLMSQSNLASALAREGRWAEAEKLYSEVLQIRRHVLGLDHPDTLTTMGNLGSAISAQNRYAEAEALFTVILHIQRQLRGPDHPDTLIAMGNLARAISRQGRYAEAKTLYVETLKLQRRVLGPDHPYTMTTLNNLAVAISRQGRWAELEKLTMEILQLQLRKLGPDHPDTLKTMYKLCLDSLLLHHTQQALQYLEAIGRSPYASEHLSNLDESAAFKPLHGNPRFEALVKKYKKVSNNPSRAPAGEQENR